MTTKLTRYRFYQGGAYDEILCEETPTGGYYDASDVDALVAELAAERDKYKHLWQDAHEAAEALGSAIAENTERKDNAERQIAALRQRAEEAERRAEWQDISTAPKDGTKVLVYVPAYNEVYACGFKHGLWQTGIWEQVRNLPTHWMPLPAQPAAGEGEGEDK